MTDTTTAQDEEARAARINTYASELAGKTPEQLLHDHERFAVAAWRDADVEAMAKRTMAHAELLRRMAS